MIKEGDRVFIGGTVSRVPGEDTTLYRITTDGEGTVLWCTLDELYISHNGHIIRAESFDKAMKEKLKKELADELSDLWEE